MSADDKKQEPSDKYHDLNTRLTVLEKGMDLEIKAIHDSLDEVHDDNRDLKALMQTHIDTDAKQKNRILIQLNFMFLAVIISGVGALIMYILNQS